MTSVALAAVDTPAIAAPLSADDIARLLPHRYPFLMLDRVTALEPGISAEGIKNVTASDAVLAGHFPGRMIYPGVLLIECVAQLAAVIYGSAALVNAEDASAGVSDRVGYLAEVRQAKFMRPVYPGDQVTLRATSGPRMGALISVTGQASVGREVVMTARLVVTERDQEE
ncbi:MAG TPA: 3-hydroxyacyl-ACP dehydratase FabZ [Micromonosporaceae bacterium]|jgi:3-hydroxyacyl-[acyl-carrier-protein] dehydratase|nr:3-hydroxyacyl-ACP dehydratase FabZ [Micromonosporaceae bacterium]